MCKYFVFLLCFSIIACCKTEETALDRSVTDIQNAGGLTYVDGQLYSGYLMDYHADGSISSHMQYHKGKQHGVTTIFYPSGRRKEVRGYFDNKKEGTHYGFWPDGKQSFEFNFIDGKYTDTLKEWYPNGQLYKLEYYENGKQVGRQKAWRKNGELYLNYDVRNGRKYGNAGIKHCKSLWSEVDTDM